MSVDHATYKKIFMQAAKDVTLCGQCKDANFIIQTSNQSCKDSVKITALLNRDKVFENILFSGDGCILSQGSAGVLVQFVKMKNLNDLKQMSWDDFVSNLPITIDNKRAECFLLSWRAFFEKIQFL